MSTSHDNSLWVNNEPRATSSYLQRLTFFGSEAFDKFEGIVIEQFIGNPSDISQLILLNAHPRGIVKNNGLPGLQIISPTRQTIA